MIKKDSRNLNDYSKNKKKKKRGTTEIVRETKERAQTKKINVNNR